MKDVRANLAAPLDFGRRAEGEAPLFFLCRLLPEREELTAEHLKRFLFVLHLTALGSDVHGETGRRMYCAHCRVTFIYILSAWSTGARKRNLELLIGNMHL